MSFLRFSLPCLSVVWPVLKSASIHCFCSELCQYIKNGAQKIKRPADVIYDFWGREDINWRRFSTKASRKICKEMDLGNTKELAFVLDDSLKPRRGKKVEATSLHHDHNSGRTIQAHQLLELGIVDEGGFIPVDRQIYTGSKKALYKTVRIKAEINLETDNKLPDRWQKVVLVLSSPQRSKHENWVVFLTTDMELTAERVLEIYSKRWAIEVYFKEVKQHLGLLAEQSGKYQVTYASVHLAAVRYLVIY